MSVPTVADVRLIMALSDAEDADLTPFLETAELIVDEDLAGSGLSADRLRRIKTFLAAHFATLALERGGLTRKDVGESAETYHNISPADRGYMMTRFGQQAMALDSTGILASTAQGNLKAEFRVV